MLIILGLEARRLRCIKFPQSVRVRILPRDRLFDKSRQGQEMKSKSLMERHVEIRLGLRRELLTKEIQRIAYLIDAVPPEEDEPAISCEGDASAQFADHEASILHLNAQLAELSEINAAFKRVADGTYGICSNCESEISFARLTCEPTAGRCTDCETRSEKDVATIGSTFSF